jgi:hypothetical protein
LETSSERGRQRLREGCDEAADTKGLQRQEIDVPLCWAPWVRWGVRRWPPQEPPLALGMEATPRGQRFRRRGARRLCGGWASPLACKLLWAQEQGAWEPDWKAVCSSGQACVAKHWPVLVLAARGLAAPWLFQHLVQLGCQPFGRSPLGGKGRPLSRGGFSCGLLSR